MQAPTHLLTGVLLQRICDNIPHPFVRVVATVSLGVLSHGILDRIARLTYHPPDAQWHDSFWVAYHASLVIVTIHSLRKYWREYWLGILSALAPDVDWLVLHSTQLLSFSVPFFSKAKFHEVVYVVVDALPFIRVFADAPTKVHNRGGILLDLIIVASLSFVLVKSKHQSMVTLESNLDGLDQNTLGRHAET
jgi:hypothetical protein